MTINTQTVSVSIAWREIHDRALVVDAARQGTSIGRDGVTDAFGGQYYPPWYESRGLAGLVSLVAAARRLQYDAWKAVHVAKDRLDAAAVEVASDADQRWSVVPGRPDMQHRTRRGAAWRASRYGGRTELRSSGRRAAERVQKVRQQTAAAIATALTIHPLMSALATTDAVDYQPSTEICGQDAGRVNIQGVAWLRGEVTDGGRPEIARAIELVREWAGQ